MLKTFDIPVSFVFDGVFKIKAKTLKQAEGIVLRNCAMILKPGCIHSSLQGDEIDWEFPVHAEKIIITS
jgi:hypothetical protein